MLDQAAISSPVLLGKSLVISTVVSKLKGMQCFAISITDTRMLYVWIQFE